MSRCPHPTGSPPSHTKKYYSIPICWCSQVSCNSYTSDSHHFERLRKPLVDGSIQNDSHGGEDIIRARQLSFLFQFVNTHLGKFLFSWSMHIQENFFLAWRYTLGKISFLASPQTLGKISFEVVHTDLGKFLFCQQIHTQENFF